MDHYARIIEERRSFYEKAKGNAQLQEAFEVLDNKLYIDEAAEALNALQGKFAERINIVLFPQKLIERDAEDALQRFVDLHNFRSAETQRTSLERWQAEFKDAIVMLELGDSENTWEVSRSFDERQLSESGHISTLLPQGGGAHLWKTDLLKLQSEAKIGPETGIRLHGILDAHMKDFALQLWAALQLGVHLSPFMGRSDEAQQSRFMKNVIEQHAAPWSKIRFGHVLLLEEPLPDTQKKWIDGETVVHPRALFS